MIKQVISYIGLHVYQEYTHSHPVSDQLSGTQGKRNWRAYSHASFVVTQPNVHC